MDCWELGRANHGAVTGCWVWESPLKTGEMMLWICVEPRSLGHFNERVETDNVGHSKARVVVIWEQWDMRCRIVPQCLKPRGTLTSHLPILFLET